MKNRDTYKEAEIHEYPNAVVRVYRPILTPEERAKRMAKIEQATAKLLYAADLAKRNSIT